MLVLLVLLLPALAVAQEQTPTFRTGVSSVLVDTLALDSDGNPVPDLTVDDFEIYEDDVRQTIQSFDVTDWTSYVAAKTSDAPSSGASSINTYPRRFIFIFNRQGAEFDWLVRAKRALNEFVVESMADGDEAMVIDVAFSTKVTQQLQASKEDTLESIRKLVPMVVPYPMGPRSRRRFSLPRSRRAGERPQADSRTQGHRFALERAPHVYRTGLEAVERIVLAPGCGRVAEPSQHQRVHHRSPGGSGPLHHGRGAVAACH